MPSNSCFGSLFPARLTSFDPLRTGSFTRSDAFIHSNGPYGEILFKQHPSDGCESDAGQTVQAWIDSPPQNEILLASLADQGGGVACTTEYGLATEYDVWQFDTVGIE